jgi:hypothetical protein
MDAVIARQILKRRFYEGVQGNRPPLEESLRGDALGSHNTVFMQLMEDTFRLGNCRFEMAPL